jgi:hypothetical protein
MATPFTSRRFNLGNGQYEYTWDEGGQHHSFIAGPLGSAAVIDRFNAMMGIVPKKRSSTGSSTGVDNEEQWRRDEVQMDPELQYDPDFHYESMAERKAKDKIRSNWDAYEASRSRY